MPRKRKSEWKRKTEEAVSLVLSQMCHRPQMTPAQFAERHVLRWQDVAPSGAVVSMYDSIFDGRPGTLLVWIISLTQAKKRKLEKFPDQYEHPASLFHAHTRGEAICAWFGPPGVMDFIRRKLMTD